MSIDLDSRHGLRSIAVFGETVLMRVVGAAVRLAGQ
jgi:hypothetical protein